jgi:hypothetical protein
MKAVSLFVGVFVYAVIGVVLTLTLANVLSVAGL